MPILLATPLVLWLISTVMFQAPKQADFRFSLAHQYVKAGGVLDFWQNIFSYAGNIIVLIMVIYMNIRRKAYQNRPNFALLDGARFMAFCGAAYQMVIIYWSVQLCHLRATCHHPAEYWEFAPLFLGVSLMSGVYSTYLFRTAKR